MAALVMGLASEQPVGIDDGSFIATSFPGFVVDDAGAGRGIELGRGLIVTDANTLISLQTGTRPKFRSAAGYCRAQIC